jgi:hypothetical protein
LEMDLMSFLGDLNEFPDLTHEVNILFQFMISQQLSIFQQGLQDCFPPFAEDLKVNVISFGDW